MARIRPRVFQEVTTEGEALALVAEVGVAALALSSAQYRPRGHIVFRRFVDELLTAEMALAHFGQNGSPILTSLRAFLLETFQPLTAGRFRETRLRQMNLF